jgi:glycosyltransferase involved in cell wall biosynthesis
LDGRFRVRALPLSDRLANAVWYRCRLPAPVQLVTGRFDLFHSPDFTLPPTLGKPAVLTIHDLAFLTVPDCAYPTLRSYLERVVPRSVARAAHVIAVSESTRRDVISRLGIPSNRVTTVVEGVGREFRPLGPEDRGRGLERLGIHTPYILSVGTLEPRKNYSRLLEAYSLLRQRGLSHALVIAGGLGWLYEPIFARLRELRLERHVTFLEPDDASLVALYSAADVFVYPSLYEGFGIPPLEALACGAPVACSNTSSLPEVVGEAALTFDPLEPEQMAEAIWSILSDDALRADLRRKGPARAALFAWERAAEETVQVYRQVARG